MFGRRGNDEGARTATDFRSPAPMPLTPVNPAETPAARAKPAEPKPVAPVAPTPPARKSPEPVAAAVEASRRPQRERSETYYDTKSQVFSALIDTIDLSQLAKLEAESAREEIRDIVNDIIAIKNFAMS